MTRRGVIHAWVLGAVLLAAPTTSAAALSPGVVTQAPLTERDFARMERGGVESLRFLLRWPAVEAVRGEHDWSSIDPIVSAAAAADIDLLPLVSGSPTWIADTEIHPPLDSQAHRDAWRGFLTALVDRYGPRGRFWAGVADPQPITSWQIWNEPNFDFYWHPRPSAEGYAGLLEISARAIRAADPKAEIVMAGIAPVANGVPWWRYLRRLYRVPGFARAADVIALHPYSPTIDDLRTQVRLARRIMRANGDRRKDLAITEIGWSSGHVRAPLVAGPRGQARLLRRAYGLLASKTRWRITDVQWYAWQDSLIVEDFCVFCEQAGLFTRRAHPKLAWDAYRAVARRLDDPPPRRAGVTG